MRSYLYLMLGVKERSNAKEKGRLIPSTYDLREPIGEEGLIERRAK